MVRVALCLVRRLVTGLGHAKRPSDDFVHRRDVGRNADPVRQLSGHHGAIHGFELVAEAEAGESEDGAQRLDQERGAGEADPAL